MAGASTVLTNLTVLTTAGQIRFDHRSTRFDRRRPKAPGELRRGPIVGPASAGQTDFDFLVKLCFSIARGETPAASSSANRRAVATS